MRTSAILISLLACASLFGQSMPAAGISPIPVLPQGGSIPSGSTQYVFLGPKVDQVTISFPAGLALGDLTGYRTTYQVDLVNQVVSSALATVSPAAGSAYDYAYTLQNGIGARKGVQVWSLGLPSADAVSSATHATWAAAMERQDGVPQSAKSMTVPLHFVTWRNPNADAVAPGMALRGFHVYSTYRPGFTLAYARSADNFVLPANLPAEVVSQLAALRQPQWFNQPFLTIGPRFPEGWSKQFIAADYLVGINRLVRGGQLDASSPFVSAARSALNTFVMTQGAASNAALDFLGTASGALETSIAGALQLSLQ